MKTKLKSLFSTPQKPTKSTPCNLGPLAPYVKPRARNFGVILDSNLNLDKQISSAVKSSFYQLRTIAKLNSVRSHNDLEKVIRAFMTSRLDYCNSLCFCRPTAME